MGKKIVSIPEWSNFYPTVSEIGTITNITPTSFEVSDINLATINRYLGTNYKSVSEACKSNVLNQWALYKPNGNAPYKIGDFAGYNKYAMPPTHFYQLPSFTGLKWEAPPPGSGTNFRDFYVWLFRGEKYPTAPNNDPWEYVRVTLTFNDTLNGQTLTFNSPVQEVQRDTPTRFDIKFTSTNIKRSGTVTIAANYMNGMSSTIVQHIEEPQKTSIPFEIDRRLIVATKEQCTQTYLSPSYAYYSNGSTLYTLSANDFKTAGSIYGYISPEFPYYIEVPNTTNFTNTIFLRKNSGGYDRIRVQRVNYGGTYGNYELGAGTDYLYFITEVVHRNNLPSNYNDLFN